MDDYRLDPPVRFHHVTLTVTDVAVSAAWYRRALDAHPVAERAGDGWRRIVLRTGGGLTIGLTEHDGTVPSDEFDETRVGLDHIALECADPAAVEAWAETLASQGLDPGPVRRESYATTIVVRDPDGIAVELFAPTS